MKFQDLGDSEKDKLRFESRSLLDGIKRADITLPLTQREVVALASRNYQIQPDGEVTRTDREGYTRICAYGIPCTYRCSGLASGSCSQIKKPE